MQYELLNIVLHIWVIYFASLEPFYAILAKPTVYHYYPNAYLHNSFFFFLQECENAVFLKN